MNKNFPSLKPACCRNHCLLALFSRQRSNALVGDGFHSLVKTMAQPRLRALFFASVDGKITTKAPPLKRSDRWKMLHENDLLCAECGVRVTIFLDLRWHGYQHAHIDHILPRSRGGQNDALNLRVLCGRCNMSKGAK